MIEKGIAPKVPTASMSSPGELPDNEIQHTPLVIAYDTPAIPKAGNSVKNPPTNIPMTKNQINILLKLATCPDLML